MPFERKNLDEPPCVIQTKDKAAIAMAMAIQEKYGGQAGQLMAKGIFLLGLQLGVSVPSMPRESRR